jgi:hypothetical protein
MNGQPALVIMDIQLGLAAGIAGCRNVKWLHAIRLLPTESDSCFKVPRYFDTVRRFHDMLNSSLLSPARKGKRGNSDEKNSEIESKQEGTRRRGVDGPRHGAGRR